MTTEEVLYIASNNLSVGLALFVFAGNCLIISGILCRINDVIMKGWAVIVLCISCALFTMGTYNIFECRAINKNPVGYIEYIKNNPKKN